MDTPKKQNRITPTTKQLILAKKYVENLRAKNPKSKGQLIRESGYKETVVIKPHEVFESRGFKMALLEAGITDNRLTKVMNQGLTATNKRYAKNKETGKLTVVASEPDHAIRHKYLETVLKVRGDLNATSQSTPAPVNQQNNFFINGDEVRQGFATYMKQLTSDRPDAPEQAPSVTEPDAKS